MGDNSSLAFNNFLMTRKLDELLRLALNEHNQEKLIYIQRAIHMKVNYLDDNNQNLNGIAQYLHKRKIKKKYKGTKYEKLICIKEKSHFYEYFWTVILILLFFTIGASYRELVINKRQVRATYTYKDKILTKEDMLKLLKVKIQLGEIYEKKDDIKNSYLRYLEAENIAKKLEDENNLEKISEKILILEKELYNILNIKVEELYEAKNEDEIMKKSLEALQLAQLLQNFEQQGKIYELRGDCFYQKNKLEKSRNDYWIASKMLPDKDEIIKKIEKVEEKIYTLSIERKNKIQKIKERER